MRDLALTARVRGVPAAQVFANVARFERFPQLAPHVQSTTVHGTLPERVGSSSWELHFRSGILRWTEIDTFDPEALTIDLVQDEGDFEEFTGRWEVTADGGGARVRFTAFFDFGIESLAGILDPIAERVIKETVVWAVAGLHDDVEFDDVDVEAARVAVPAGGE